MPCGNVVELIQIKIDDHDCLTDYQFVKKTCGRGVGANSLLVDEFRGKTVETLLSLDDNYLNDLWPLVDDTIRFLQLKHLFAVQSALQVFVGINPGGKGHPCAMAEIGYDEGNFVIDAQIDVDVVAERISACLSCQGG